MSRKIPSPRLVTGRNEKSVLYDKNTGERITDPRRINEMLHESPEPKVNPNFYPKRQRTDRRSTPRKVLDGVEGGANSFTYSYLIAGLILSAIICITVVVAFISIIIEHPTWLAYLWLPAVGGFIMIYGAIKGFLTGDVSSPAEKFEEWYSEDIDDE